MPKDGVYTVCSTAGMSYDDVDGVVSQLDAAQDVFIAAINPEASSCLAASNTILYWYDTIKQKELMLQLQMLLQQRQLFRCWETKYTVAGRKGQVDGVMVIDEVKANLVQAQLPLRNCSLCSRSK